MLRAYSTPPRVRRLSSWARQRERTYKQYKTQEKQQEDSSTGTDSSMETERIHSTPTGTLATSLNITPGTSMTDWDNSTDTERQNDDRTTEQPETESSPSIPMFLVDKIRHKKSIHKASEWFLEGTDKGIQVIGDSNISRINNGSRAQIQTESFPGAQIGHINTVLNKMIGPQVENYPECVILSVGINDMNNSRGSTSPAMRKLAQKANKQFPRSRVAIPRINCPVHLSKSQKANIKASSIRRFLRPQILRSHVTQTSKAKHPNIAHC